MTEKAKTEAELYPQCVKLKNVGEAFHTVMNFMEWLGQQEEIVLAKWSKHDDRDRLFEFIGNREHLLYKFFDIDHKLLEKERQAMIDALRG